MRVFLLCMLCIASLIFALAGEFCAEKAYPNSHIHLEANGKLSIGYSYGWEWMGFAFFAIAILSLGYVVKMGVIAICRLISHRGKQPRGFPLD
jgi:hypothetical protein